MKTLYIAGSIILFIVIFFFWKKKNVEEGYDGMCGTSNNTCDNFETCCLNNKDVKCRNPDLVACQKFRIKCENRCTNKKTNDNGKKFSDENGMKDCMKICQKVQSDCCRRLNG